MEARAAPHFHNEPGVAQLRIGVRKFKCIGALPPFDHPHVFIDMGESDEAICPYCATHFHYEERLSGLCHPPECAYRLEREVSFEGPRPANAAALAKPAVPPAPGGARAARAKARAVMETCPSGLRSTSAHFGPRQRCRVVNARDPASAPRSA